MVPLPDQLEVRAEVVRRAQAAELLELALQRADDELHRDRRLRLGSEERGGYGARYFVANSPVPLEKIVADFNFEMLGRPDTKVPPGTLWLTGYERSTLGPELVRQGAALVKDPILIERPIVVKGKRAVIGRPPEAIEVLLK